MVQANLDSLIRARKKQTVVQLQSCLISPAQMGSSHELNSVVDPAVS